jgi:hypothetical protein
MHRPLLPSDPNLECPIRQGKPSPPHALDQEVDAPVEIKPMILCFMGGVICSCFRRKSRS